MNSGESMYRIGEIAKLADVTPDTIRYYEKQQMMGVLKADFASIQKAIFSA
jgi:predicted transcriptional regulator